MATWQDGPEYAPAERPSEFSVPTVAPLEVPPPPAQIAAGAPKQRPRFDGPQAAAPPQDRLVPVVADHRDPARPFDVAQSTLTSMDSAWGSAHMSAPAHSAPGPAAAPGPPADSWGAPADGPWPAPVAQEPQGPSAFPPPAANAFPPPGTPQWFGPGPASAAPTTRPVVDARAVVTAATPGLVIVLAIGGFVYVLAPIMLGVAFFLSSRVRVAQRQVRAVFVAGWVFVGLVALLTLLGDYLYFSDWWRVVGGWALVVCWTLLVTLLVQVYRALRRRGGTPTSSYPSNWG